jgi:hypothetical protein
MQQMSASAQNLSSLAEGLRTALRQFKVTKVATKKDAEETQEEDDTAELVGAAGAN